MSRDHVTGGDLEVTSFDWRSPRSGCRRPVSQLVGTFELVHGGNSQEVAVMRQEMRSRELT